MPPASGEQRLTFRFRDRTVEVRAERGPWLDLLRTHWSTGPVEPRSGDAPPVTYRIVTGSEGRPVLRTPGGPVGLDAERTALHAYHRILGDLLGEIDRSFAFHGTAVARGNAALLVSGPSTFGKSTLGIHLALRGARWLADDVALVDRDSGEVEPFDRRLRLRPGARAMLPAEALERARTFRTAVEDEDWIVDPARWLPAAGRPVPLRLVLLLRPRDDLAEVRKMPYQAVRVRDDSADLLGPLRTLEGVRGVGPPGDDPFRIDLEIERPEAIDRFLAEHAERIVYAVKFATSPATFEAGPAISPLPRFQAALELCQEMQNRRPGSRLEREYRGRALELVADVAARLAGARCFALAPGRLPETILEVERLLDEAAGG